MWEPSFIIAFAAPGGVIEAGLQSDFGLWMPTGVPNRGDRDVPAAAKKILSKYVTPE